MTRSRNTDGEQEREDKFFEAPEVEEIARDVISKHHSHLVEASIAYLFRRGDWKSKGQTLLGKAFKASERDKTLHGYDFLVIMNRDYWLLLTPEQRKALVDHELCHCDRGEDDAHGNPKWSIVEHDVDEFGVIIKRHGLWKPNLRAFAETVQQKQVELFGDKPARDEAAATQVN